MEFLKGLWERWSTRIVILSKWIVFSCLIGAVVGVVGGVFHEAVNLATETREAHDWPHRPAAAETTQKERGLRRT